MDAPYGGPEETESRLIFYWSFPAQIDLVSTVLVVGGHMWKYSNFPGTGVLLGVLLSGPCSLELQGREACIPFVVLQATSVSQNSLLDPSLLINFMQTLIFDGGLRLSFRAFAIDLRIAEDHGSSIYAASLDLLLDSRSLRQSRRCYRDRTPSKNNYVSNISSCSSWFEHRIYRDDDELHQYHGEYQEADLGKESFISSREVEGD
ncbi:hypothetical protein F5880DRAFT_1512367 [Lentinula raphanica]|nr:hypothetical protein F5880DRAFT_1512367 [Lentinula raphanica]